MGTSFSSGQRSLAWEGRVSDPSIEDARGRDVVAIARARHLPKDTIVRLERLKANCAFRCGFASRRPHQLIEAHGGPSLWRRPKTRTLDARHSSDPGSVG